MGGDSLWIIGSTSVRRRQWVTWREVSFVLFCFALHCIAVYTCKQADLIWKVFTYSSFSLDLSATRSSLSLSLSNCVCVCVCSGIRVSSPSSSSSTTSAATLLIQWDAVCCCFYIPPRLDTGVGGGGFIIVHCTMHADGRTDGWMDEWTDAASLLLLLCYV